MIPFHYDESNLPSSPAHVANIPSGITDPLDLLEELAIQLNFPDYYGMNWNALDECIRELSWLPRGSVVLRHHDLPLHGDIASQKTYISILAYVALNRYHHPGQRLSDLVVVFPPDAKDEVERLYALHEAELQNCNALSQSSGAVSSIRFDKQARLRWLGVGAPGRSPPPLGTIYSSLGRFEVESVERPDGVWRVLLQFVAPVDSEGCTIVGIRLLAGRRAPTMLLAPGSRFELYEGRRCIAHGEVLGPQDSH